MIDAYETLGLPNDADEAQIRTRYLELVREFPPDRAPERFAEILRRVRQFAQSSSPTRAQAILLVHTRFTGDSGGRHPRSAAHR